MKFEVCDILSLPAEFAEAFDIALAYLILNCVADLHGALQQMGAVCARRALLIVVLPHPDVVEPREYDGNQRCFGDPAYYEFIDERMFVPVINYYRPLKRISEAAEAAGFRLTGQEEPLIPDAALQQSQARVDEMMQRRGFPDPSMQPWFVCLRFEKSKNDE